MVDTTFRLGARAWIGLAVLMAVNLLFVWAIARTDSLGWQVGVGAMILFISTRAVRGMVRVGGSIQDSRITWHDAKTTYQLDQQEIHAIGNGLQRGQKPHGTLHITHAGGTAVLPIRSFDRESQDAIEHFLATSPAYMEPALTRLIERRNDLDEPPKVRPVPQMQQEDDQLEQWKTEHFNLSTWIVFGQLLLTVAVALVIIEWIQLPPPLPAAPMLAGLGWAGWTWVRRARYRDDMTVLELQALQATQST